MRRLILTQTKRTTLSLVALALLATLPAGAASADKTAAIEPVVVDLGQIAGQPHPTDLASGEDLEVGEHGRVDDETLAALQERARHLPVSDRVQDAREAQGEAPDPLGSFVALDNSQCCGGGSVTPPDPSLAAGPNHLIAMINLAFGIYDKTGTLLTGPTTTDSFFGPAGGGCLDTFDPTTVYDEEADRFVMVVDGNGTDFCIAVSQTPDPTGSWNIYRVPAQPVGGEFHDYPHTGVGDSYVVVGGNQFGGSVPGGFEGRVWALDKAVMYAGGALTPVTASTGDEGTPQPLNLHGAGQGTWPALGATHYFATDPYNGCTLNIWRWNVPSPPTIVASFDLCAATGVASGQPVPAPQSGGSSINANDFRMRGFEYRNGHGWLADAISCNPGGGTVDCIRWSEVDLVPATPTLAQAGVYASAAEYRIYPDLAVNACDDMAIGYSKTSSSTFPGIFYTGRESGDPAGTLQAEAMLKAGEVTFTSFDAPPYRWGDYTEMTIDPDGTTFWYLGEYSKNIATSSKWGTYVGAFEYPGCVPAGPSCPAGTNAATVYEQDFEAGAGGWTHSGTGDTWTLSGANPHSGVQSFFASNPATVSDQRLVSPAIALPAGQNPLTLDFWNWQHMETRTGGCFDGGILEVSTNGGSTWTQVPDASLLTDPYDGPISASFSNPLAGLDAWCGDNPQPYLASQVDVSAYAGQTVQFRFRIGTDNSVSRPGWYVDDVRVQSCDPMPFIDGFESGDTSAWSSSVP